MDPVVSATIGANIEANFATYAKYSPDKPFDLEFTIPGDGPNESVPYTCSGLRVLKVMEFETNDKLYDPNGIEVAVEGPKGIILTDAEGNIYVHFNGTGDGKWKYNATNYGGDPSEIQTDSLAFFEEFIENEYQGGNIYVSGHSQGGNTAQYVTIGTKYGDYIDSCISLDGPGLSNDTVNTAIDKYGEAYFDRQCNKIYGFYGEHDYVSALGQRHIIPENHITYVKNTGGDFHVITGMMNGTSLNTLLDEGSAFRDLVVALNAKLVAEMDPNNQERVAFLAMLFAEMLLGDDYLPSITQQDYDELTAMLIPVLAEFIEENPDMIYPALLSIGVDKDTAKVIEKCLNGFSLLPESMRLDILNALKSFIVVSEDGKLQLCQGLQDLINGVISIAEFLDNYPILTGALTIGLVLCLPLILKIMGDLTIFAAIVTGLYALVDTLQNLGDKLCDFVRNTITALKARIDAIKEYLHNQTPGARYVRDNPAFRADTGLMREYANRLRAVNGRLTSLDRDLDDLYWQVGLLDVYDILRSNIIAGYSPRIGLCQRYLNSAADALEDADRKALGYMGG